MTDGQQRAVAQGQAVGDTAGAGSAHRWATVTAWAVTAIGSAVAVAVRPADQSSDWLTLVLAGSVVVAFALQLIVAERVGFVARLTASVCGSLIVVLVGAGVAAVVGAR